MPHQGESFGLAVAEFSVINKPIITCDPTVYKRSNKIKSDFDGGDERKGCAHLQILGNRALVYKSATQLQNYLVNFDRRAMAARGWNAYRSFRPAPVMRTFRCVFLDHSECDCPAYRFGQSQTKRYAKLLSTSK